MINKSMAPIDKLSDDCLLEIFEWLSPFDLFKMHRINRQFRRVAAVKLRTKIKGIALTRRTLNQIDRSFSLCTHLGGIRPDQELVLDRLFKTAGKRRDVRQPLHKPRRRVLFLKIMARCAGVRSIDFSWVDLPDGLLLEVVKSCSQIECINLGHSVIEEDEWSEILDLIGPKIVHFVKEKNFFYDTIIDIRMLTAVAEKCLNIKQVYWKLSSCNSGLMAAFKMLPKNCWTTLECCYSLDSQFEDVFDELDAELTDRFIGDIFIKHRFDRLSSLKLRIRVPCNIGPDYVPKVVVEGVDFTGLKKLDVSTIQHTNNHWSFLLASRFPRLEEFIFYPYFRMTEDDYKNIFQKMKSVKKLTILCQHDYGSSNDLPRSAIHQLKNLEDIRFKIGEVRKDWQSNNFAHQLEEYVDEISSLKKLTVDTRNRFSDGWAKTIIEMLKQMRLKHSQVEIDLVCGNKYLTVKREKPIPET